MHFRQWNDPIEIKSLLAWVMAWGHTCDKPLDESMITYLTDAYTWHNVALSLGNHSQIPNRIYIQVSKYVDFFVTQAKYDTK